MPKRTSPARPGFAPLVWGYIALVLAVLYVPLIPPILFSFETGAGGAGALRWYAQLWRNPILTSSIITTFKIGIIVAIATTITLPYGALVGVLLYLDLRARKETLTLATLRTDLQASAA